MLDKIMNKDKITSIELLEQINFFRNQEGSPNTNHKDLLIIIETEFTDINRKRVQGGMCPEVHTQIKEQLAIEDIDVAEYTHPQNKQSYPMYILPLSKAKQCLLKESKFVRKAMIQYIEKLENTIQQISDKDRLLLGLFSKDPMIIAESHKQLVELELKPLQAKIEQDAPKVEFADNILEDDRYFGCNELAKMLNIKGYGRNNLMKYMRENGILNNNNEPYQQYVTNGYCKQVPALTPIGLVLKTVFSTKMLAYLEKKLNYKEMI